MYCIVKNICLSDYKNDLTVTKLFSTGSCTHTLKTSNENIISKNTAFWLEDFGIRVGDLYTPLVSSNSSSPVHISGFFSVISFQPFYSIQIMQIMYLYNQCLSPLMLWVRISIRARCTTSFFVIKKKNCHDITEILLKVALNTINQTKPHTSKNDFS